MADDICACEKGANPSAFVDRCIDCGKRLPPMADDVRQYTREELERGPGEAFCDVPNTDESVEVKGSTLLRLLATARAGLADSELQPDDLQIAAGLCNARAPMKPGPERDAWKARQERFEREYRRRTPAPTEDDELPAGPANPCGLRECGYPDCGCDGSATPAQQEASAE